MSDTPVHVGYFDKLITSETFLNSSTITTWLKVYGFFFQNGSNKNSTEEAILGTMKENQL